jgi:insertion element IS1 protein InsB
VIAADELWSFIGQKRQVGWGWVALDARTRQVVAMVAGDRDEFTAQCLWEALPPGYCERAIVATDFLAAYQAVVSEDRHAAAGKAARLTAPGERFFGTLRQRCAQFVRRTLSFARRMENYVDALWYFVGHDNACRL